MENRYIVFVWSEYDNPSPMDCIVGQKSDLSEARVLALKEADADSGDDWMILDRKTGEWIK